MRHRWTKFEMRHTDGDLHYLSTWIMCQWLRRALVLVIIIHGVYVCRSMSVGGVTFPLEQQSKDPQSVVYTGQYNTEGVVHTKSGERQPVQINIQVWMRAKGQKLIWKWRQKMFSTEISFSFFYKFINSKDLNNTSKAQFKYCFNCETQNLYGKLFVLFLLLSSVHGCLSWLWCFQWIVHVVGNMDVLMSRYLWCSNSYSDLMFSLIYQLFVIYIANQAHTDIIWYS